MSPEGLLKSLLVEIRGMLPKRFFARNSDMMLVPTTGMCRASMFVPLNEQGMRGRCKNPNWFGRMFYF